MNDQAPQYRVVDRVTGKVQCNTPSLYAAVDFASIDAELFIEILFYGTWTDTEATIHRKCPVCQVEILTYAFGVMARLGCFIHKDCIKSLFQEYLKDTQSWSVRIAKYSIDKEARYVRKQERQASRSKDRKREG